MYRYKSDVCYFKLPCVGNPSYNIINKLLETLQRVCKQNFNNKLSFNSLKIKIFLSCKDSIPNDLKSFLVHKFTDPST